MTARLHTLPNGVRVVADPMPGLQSAALSVVVDAGARWEAAERNGWSHLLEHMVFKGAGARTSRGIVEAIEREGGWINAATGYERTSYQVRHLAGGARLAMEVLADLVRRPVIDAAELEREKGVIGQEIAEAGDTPDDRVFDLAQARAFGDTPLGRPILGLDVTLAPATRGALMAHHADLYGDPARIVVSAAGAVDEAELLGLAEAAFGDMPTAPIADPVAPATFAGGTWAEARPLEQAHMVLLLPGVSALDPDAWTQRLFAEVLGGGMASRLFQEARETRGPLLRGGRLRRRLRRHGPAGRIRRGVGHGRGPPWRGWSPSRWRPWPSGLSPASWTAPAPRRARACSWAVSRRSTGPRRRRPSCT